MRGEPGPDGIPGMTGADGWIGTKVRKNFWQGGREVEGGVVRWLHGWC